MRLIRLLKEAVDERLIRLLNEDVDETNKAIERGCG